MIHNDIQNQLALLVKTSAPPLIEVADTPIEAPQWVPGQRLPAHVIASLPNGRFQVQVENQVLDMNLPRNSEPGETVELTFLSASPRMTFALTQELATSLPAPANSGVTLSDTAKFLGALLQKSGAAASNLPMENKVATAALALAPAIVPGSPPATREFALALRTAVSQSGLFYESHQAQWVSGERTLASLMQEPQARLPAINAVLDQLRMPATVASLPGQTQVAAAGVPGQPQADEPATSPQAVSAHASLPRSGAMPQELARDFSTVPRAGEGALTAQEPVHRLAQPIVQQQLDTLESRQILWQGQVWPGQPMDWTIDEDGSQGARDGDEAPRWSTSMHLDMPLLGGVAAKLMLDGSGIRVDLLVDREQTAAQMGNEIDRLAQSMQAVGLKVAGLRVSLNGEA